MEFLGFLVFAFIVIMYIIVKNYFNDTQKVLRFINKTLKNAELTDENIFWIYIDATNKYAKSHYRMQIYLLENVLLNSKTNVIISFYNTFYLLVKKAKTDELYTAFYIIYNRKKEFESFLYWLISRGKERYYDAITNPDIIANYSLPEIYTWDGIEDCAEFAYEKQMKMYISDVINREKYSSPKPKLVPEELWDKKFKNLLDLNIKKF